MMCVLGDAPVEAPFEQWKGLAEGEGFEGRGLVDEEPCLWPPQGTDTERPINTDVKITEWGAFRKQLLAVKQAHAGRHCVQPRVQADQEGSDGQVGTGGSQGAANGCRGSVNHRAEAVRPPAGGV